MICFFFSIYRNSGYPNDKCFKEKRRKSFLKLKIKKKDGKCMLESTWRCSFLFDSIRERINLRFNEINFQFKSFIINKWRSSQQKSVLIGSIVLFFFLFLLVISLYNCYSEFRYYYYYCELSKFVYKTIINKTRILLFKKI